MANIILEDQQAAIIFSITENGIQVKMTHEGEVGLAAGLSEVICRRLIEDEKFRQELLGQVEKNAAGDY